MAGPKARGPHDKPGGVQQALGERGAKGPDADALADAWDVVFKMEHVQRTALVRAQDPREAPKRSAGFDNGPQRQRERVDLAMEHHPQRALDGDGLGGKPPRRACGVSGEWAVEYDHPAKDGYHEVAIFPV